MPGTAASASFPKRERLRKRSEFLDLQEHARRKVQTDFFLLLWQPRGEGDVVGAPRSRVGITVSSRVGNSVVRNRLKRWIREFLRHNKGRLPAGEMVVVTKAGASDRTHDVLDRDLERLFARAGQR